MNRSIATASLLVWTAFASPAFSAEKAVEAAAESRLALASLAPPGRCAEPRVTATAPAESYPVAGPVSSLFDPRDVAASPLESELQQPGPPSARALVRPGACDQPGAGCGASAVAAPAVVVPPVTPGVRPPRSTR